MVRVNLLILFAGVHSAPPSYFVGKTTLTPSDVMMLQSENAQFFARCGRDGNFCVYQGTVAHPDAHALYCMNDFTLWDRSKCVFEDDGNFVLFDNNGDPQWETKDHPAQKCDLPATDYYSPHTMYLQNDGNLCISNNKYGLPRPLWCSGTNVTKP
mmetsp:Transcript_3627/g.8171  ORF Transcript_3627/g.8171 Transcript_3627/m.8171 type:complete len:155 (-) Transcript_3627:80-544(-)